MDHSKHDAMPLEEVQDKLWDAIDDHHTGMLGLADARSHFQPMTAFVDRDAEAIWFYSSRDSDLMEAAGAGNAPVMFTFQSRDLYACIEGRLTLDTDRERIDRYWNAHVAAWYPVGKDDPNLVMFRMDARNAAVWVVKGGLVRYLVEVARANTTGSTPDVGERRDVAFR